MSNEQLVFAFHNTTKFCFERAPVHTASAFGGPMVDVTGVSHGPRPLHMIARLGLLHVPTLSQSFISEIPLIYGMFYDGCMMRYRIESSHKIELLKLTPRQSSDDWPYENYPPLLPYVPLRLSDVPRSASYSDFIGALPNPNMPEEQPAELVVVVPPPATVGVSLWGIGDGDDTMIVFECDLKKREVSAYNVTT